MLGFGASEQRAGQDASFGAQGELFAALLQAWGPGSPAVVAHDYGGAVRSAAQALTTVAGAVARTTMSLSLNGPSRPPRSEDVDSTTEAASPEAASVRSHGVQLPW